MIIQINHNPYLWEIALFSPSIISLRDRYTPRASWTHLDTPGPLPDFALAMLDKAEVTHLTALTKRL